MSKLWKRLSSKDFKKIFNNGVYISGNYINVILEVSNNENLVGFTVKKGKRNITVKNRIRRRIKEAFIKIQDFLPSNIKIALIANPESMNVALSDISAEIIRLVNKLKIRLNY